jgi:hypothetical protein
VRALALVVLTACGRVAFDPVDDGGTPGAVPDGYMDDGALGDGANVESDLLMHFAFEADGLLVDRARAHPAACHDTCPPTTTGRIGATAVLFSGSQCLEVSDAADLRPATFTTSLWVNLQAADGEVFSRPRNGATTSNNVMEVFAAASGVLSFNAGSASLGRQVSTGAWHHLATTLEGTAFTVYIDGAVMGSMTTSALSYASDPYLIGCERDNNVDVFRLRGAVDDLRLYERALTAEEIAALASM